MTNTPRIFVTGGAGYIGSHCVKALGEAGYDVLVYDNLSTGHEWSVLAGRLVVGDLADIQLLKETMMAYRPDAVIHFAAHIQVEESVRDPLKYYRNNVINSFNLLESMKGTAVSKLIYSSTAAVYGIPEKIPCNEDTPLNPINPYGATKVMVERALRDIAASWQNFRYVALRYFNVAGADPAGSIGQAYKESTHIITRALKTAKGEFPHLKIYGTDYPTPDGTCIRDYIHVNDLAHAHILAFEHIQNGGDSAILNCGYGTGFSVREVVEAAQKVTGVAFPVIEADRRAGDPPALVADSSRLRSLTGWKPQYNDLSFIIKTAWAWEEKLAKTA